ncbi:MAG TPA: hypothetical protein VLA88_01775 [Candidatus Saccharimonadales bacterium]|nr:hypothetical protein [Candidatus Saccharimonadales bacterium]
MLNIAIWVLTALQAVPFLILAGVVFSQKGGLRIVSMVLAILYGSYVLATAFAGTRQNTYNLTVCAVMVLAGVALLVGRFMEDRQSITPLGIFGVLGYEGLIVSYATVRVLQTAGREDWLWAPMTVAAAAVISLVITCTID